MAYSVELFAFSKRINSTSRPGNISVKKSFLCDVMPDSPVTNPVIVIDSSDDNISVYNYARLQALGRYYYVDNWSYDSGLWRAHLSVDVLASYKQPIENITAYVARSASNYDNYIPDNKYPIKVGATYNSTSKTQNPFAASFSQGSFVLGIINGDTNSIGAVSYYVFTSAELRSLSYYLLTNVAQYGVTDISEQLTKILYNPFQYIASAIWLPVAAAEGASMSSVPIGWWSAPVTCRRLSGYPRVSGTVTIDIPRNPEASVRPYMMAEPYTEYYLDFPPFGNVSIAADNLVNATLIDCAWNVDCITGMGKVSLGADNSARPFNILHAQVGVPIQLAQMAPDVKAIAQQALGSFDTGFPFIDSTLNRLADIGSAMLSRKLPMQSVGSNGGFMAGYYPIRLTGIFHGIGGESVTEFGRPCCKTLRLGDLSGFVQCAHGEFQSAFATRPEIEEVNSHLTTGFYMED